MFDIGFPELLLVSVVALLVIGPDKLPETVRTVALWVGRIRRGLANIKAEIENEIGADEIRQQLHNESILAEVEDANGKTDYWEAVPDPGEAESGDNQITAETNNPEENDGRQQSESGR